MATVALWWITTRDSFEAWQWPPIYSQQDWHQEDHQITWDGSVCKNELSGGVDDNEAQVDDQEADAYKETDEEDEEAEDNFHTSMNRKLAMEKKNRKQEESAKKAMERRGDAALSLVFRQVLW